MYGRNTDSCSKAIVMSAFEHGKLVNNLEIRFWTMASSTIVQFCWKQLRTKTKLSRENLIHRTHEQVNWSGKICLSPRDLKSTHARFDLALYQDSRPPFYLYWVQSGQYAIIYCTACELWWGTGRPRGKLFEQLGRRKSILTIGIQSLTAWDLINKIRPQNRKIVKADGVGNLAGKYCKKILGKIDFFCYTRYIRPSDH
jgi:hypothetical protein